MIVALTGTPGTGKSSVAKHLSQKYEVRAVSELAEEFGCIMGEEPENGEKVLLVDVECLAGRLRGRLEGRLEEQVKAQTSGGLLIVEGHLSHLLPSDLIIVLRCNPVKLKERLKTKSWKEDKILENVEAELLDVILIEAMDMEVPVYEIDTTDKTPEEVAEIIVELVERERKGEKVENFLPGKIDWIGEIGERVDEVTRHL
ncbi:MAG: AAA family ATPase [Archaeoglobus sp.]|nr:AAA family ATPase [Archaeoglobus sp.]